MSTRPAATNDPFLNAQIESSLAPWRALGLPRSLLEAMEDTLAEALTNHPVAVALLDHLRARPVPLSSGEVARDGAEDEGAAGGGEQA